MSPAPVGPSVFDLPVSTRPGGVRGSGREEKTKNRKQGGHAQNISTELYIYKRPYSTIMGV